MAATSGPIASPMSPVIKRSTRKRQRPTFFAEEIAATATPSTTRKHSTHTNQRSTRPRSHQNKDLPTNYHPPTRHVRARSELSELSETVTGLREQVESATVQMQELRSLVTMLADLYRQEDIATDEATLFSATSSELDTDEMFSTTTSEHDAAFDEEEKDDWLTTPLSPL